MVSEAVEEVLSLVQNATQVFKAMIGTENSLLVQGTERHFFGLKSRQENPFFINVRLGY